MIEIGDRVKKQGDSSKVRGTVKCVMANASQLWKILEYGVLWDGAEKVMYYLEGDLIRILEKPGKCSCGAKKTYAPNPPPGHAHHCDVNKIIETEIEEDWMPT